MPLERQRMKSVLGEFSPRDPLTGLYNREGLLLLAEEQIKLARRNENGFLVFYIDLNGMKAINDRFGQEAGDRALKDAAEVLRRTFRDSDIVARLGGDEFAALAIDASPDSLVLLLVRLQDRVRALNKHPGRSYDLSLAVGSARFEANEEPGIEDLLHRAEEDLSRQRRLKGGAAPTVSGGKGMVDGEDPRRR